MGLKRAKKLVANTIESAISTHSDIFTVIDENNLKVGNMVITLTPCINGSVMVTDNGFEPEIVGMEFHSNVTTLVFDVIRRAKMILNFENTGLFILCENDSHDLTVKCINREVIIN